MKYTRYIILIAYLFIVEIGSAAGNENGEDAVGALEIHKLADSLYLHISYQQVQEYGLIPSNGLVYVDVDQAYILDTPWQAADTLRLLDWIKAQGWQAKASLATHFHADRASGIEQLNAIGVDTYASALTNQLLREHEQPQARIEFTEHAFALLPNKIEVFYPGGGHTADNLVVWLPEQKILHGGCLIRAATAQSMGNTADAVPQQWAASVANVLERFPDAKQVVPGHGEIGSRELFLHTIERATEHFGSQAQD